MATIVGYDVEYKRFTCYNCFAIVEYSPKEQYYSGSKDEGVLIKGVTCPGCYVFNRTNH